MFVCVCGKLREASLAMKASTVPPGEAAHMAVRRMCSSFRPPQPEAKCSPQIRVHDEKNTLLVEHFGEARFFY